MMKPSDSSGQMNHDGAAAQNNRNEMHRNFNQTQHVYSEEKVYPGGRAHTIDPVDFDGLHQGMSDISPSPNKARNTHTNQFATEDSTTQAMTRTNAY